MVLAVNWTGPIDMAAGDSITRGAYLSEGAYTLHVEADGPVNVQVQTQTWEDAVMNRKQTAYSGAADGASFNAPADNRSVTFIVTADASVHIDAIRYDGAASGQLRLNYTLLPEAIAGRIQTLRSEGNVVQRTVYIQDAMKLFSRSPVVGLGMGAFENGIYNVQSYHYETKYVHNHYVQSMVDTGIIGLLLWVGTLAASAIAVFRLWRKEREQQAFAMSAALGALLLFLMIHAAVEVIFSSGYFLPFGYGALAVVNLCCGDLLPLTFAKESARRWMARAEGLGGRVRGAAVHEPLGRQPRPAGQLRCGPGGRGSGPLRVADHKLSYVYSASAETDLPAGMQETLERYMADLEKLNSNSVPKYLAEADFRLGRTEQGFAMLDKYVDYTPSDPDTWDASFRLVMQYNDNSAAFLAGASQLRDKLTEWNAQNLGAITLKDDVAAYLSEMLG